MLKKILIFSIIATLQCLTQWRWVNPTTNTRSINEIKFYEDFITLTGNKGNILISKDNGKSWQDYSDYGSYDIVKTHFINSDSGYIVGSAIPEYFWGIHNASVFKFTPDQGKNWIEIDFTQDDGYIQDFCIYNNNIWIYYLKGAGCLWFGNFIYHSTDRGKNWKEMEARDLGYCNTAIALDDTTIIIQSFYVRYSFNYNIVKSTDAGTTWNYMHNLGYYQLNSLEKISDDLIIGGGYKGIIVKSTDRGETWQTMFLPDNCDVLKITGTNNEILTLATDTNKIYVYLSTNGGSNWRNIFETNEKFNTIGLKTKGDIWLGGDGGRILRSTDNGKTWFKYNYRYEENFNSVNFSSPSKGMIVGETGTILATTNGGFSWNYLKSPTDSNLISVNFYPSTDLGLLVSSDGNIYRTDNGGSQWSNVYTNDNGKVKSTYFVTGDIILAAGDSNLVILSTDAGRNWKLSNQNIENSGKFIDISIPDPGCIYLGYENKIYKSTDTAKSWSKYFIENERKIIGFGFPSITTGWVLISSYPHIPIIVKKTTNGGTNWSMSFIDVYPKNLDKWKLIFVNDSSGYMIGEYFIYTSNAGIKWNVDYSIYGNDIFIQNDLKGWIVGDKGAMITNMNFKSDSSDLQFIQSYKLYQNYPNPFNEGTTIEYDIFEPGFVTIKVYNLLGEEVAVLLRRYHEAGKYLLQWKPENLPSGIYIYQMLVNQQNVARKMCYIK